MLGYGENELDSTLSTWVSLVPQEDKDMVWEKIQD